MSFDLPLDSLACALEDSRGTLTWAELCAAAKTRSRAGWNGRSIAFEAQPTREAIIELLAIWISGAVAVPMHPRWGELDRAQVFKDAALEQLLASPEPLAALVRTSGSSGTPRLAALSVRAMRAAAVASEQRLGWLEHDRWQLALPFAHVGGLSVIVRCLLARKTIVLGDGVHSIGSVVPTQLLRRVQRNERPSPSLRALLVGGATASPALVARARELGWPVRLTYGLTETCAQFATQRAGDPDDTCGPPLDGYETKFDGPRLLVRSPSLLSGFVSQGTLTQALDADGWLRTSDSAGLRDGALRIFGRVDDVIISGGEKIQPAEIEALLGGEVCVVGVPDPEWGQALVAVVARQDFAAVQHKLESLRGRASRFAIPRRIIPVDALPTNANGKLQRKEALRIALGALGPLAPEMA